MNLSLSDLNALYNSTPFSFSNFKKIDLKKKIEIIVENRSKTHILCVWVSEFVFKFSDIEHSRKKNGWNNFRKFKWKKAIDSGRYIISLSICLFSNRWTDRYEFLFVALFLSHSSHHSVCVMHHFKLIFFCIYFSSLAPVPASVQTILGTVCKDIPGSFNDTTKWVYSRGIGKCEVIQQTDFERHDVRLANQIVFAFQVRRKLK